MRSRFVLQSALGRSSPACAWGGGDPDRCYFQVLYWILQAKLHCFLHILHILVRLVRNARNLVTFMQDLASFLHIELIRILQVERLMQDSCKINTLI